MDSIKKTYIISVKEHTEYKTSSQLKQLDIQHYIPTEEIWIGNKQCKQLSQEGTLYALLSEKELEKVRKLPFILEVTPCSTVPFELSSEE